MSCPTPKIRLNPLTHKNMLTPCRKCIQCRVASRQPWELRLRNELARHGYIGSFVTMTYSDDKYDISRGLNYQHLKTYWNDLRRAGYDFTYYCVGEYGSETARCHYHALLFGIDPSERKNLFEIWGKCYYPRFTATQITSGRIRYTLKYMDKETTSFSEWSNLFPDKSKFLFHTPSGKMIFSKKGPIRPRAWLSKGLGSADLPADLQSSFYNGKAQRGISEYSLPHYYQDCISRNDIFYQYQRQFFNDRNGINKCKSDFNSLNDYYADRVSSAIYRENEFIKEVHQNHSPADRSYLDNSSSISEIMNCDFDNQFFSGRSSIFNPDFHYKVSYSPDLVSSALDVDSQVRKYPSSLLFTNKEIEKYHPKESVVVPAGTSIEEAKHLFFDDKHYHYDIDIF